MKKFLCIGLATILLCMFFAGCSLYEAEQKLDEMEEKVESKADKIEDEIEKKTDKIENEIENKTEKFDDDAAWETVKDEYDAVEIMAYLENSEKSGYTVDELKALVDTIDKSYEAIKDGITQENEQNAKDMYKAACTLERLEEKYPKLEDSLITELGDRARDMVESLYNTKSNDYREDKREFETALDRVKKFTDDSWTAIVDMMK